MQYREGTVSVENGSAVVTGDITEWATNAAPGDVFIVQGEHVPYIVGSVDSDTQITLTGNYAGSTASTLSYILSSSFTPIYNFPYPEPGDLETVAILKLAILQIEAKLAELE